MLKTNLSVCHAVIFNQLMKTAQSLKSSFPESFSFKIHKAYCTYFTAYIYLSSNPKGSLREAFKMSYDKKKPLTFCHQNITF